MILTPPAAPAGLDYDGERFIPGADPDSQYLHYHRYLALTDLVRGKAVLDIASGEGFGGWFLAQTAAQVTGVDVAQQAVDHAARRYIRSNLRFVQGDCRAIPLGDASVDVAVSFETLEHITEHDQFLSELRRVLRPNGVLVISTPETVQYNAALSQKNPFHMKELSRDAFRSLLVARFANVAVYDQGVKLASVIWPETAAPQTGGLAAQPWIQAQMKGIVPRPGMPDPVILLAIASDGPLVGLGGVYQEFPYPFPLSAIEGGAIERHKRSLEQALEQERAVIAARIALLPADLGTLQNRLQQSEELRRQAEAERATLQAETTRMMEELRELWVLSHEQKTVIQALDVSKVDKTTRKWRRKRALYTTLARAKPLIGAKLAGRMQMKSEKYARLLGKPMAGRLTPQPLSAQDQRMLAVGSKQAVPPKDATPIDVSIVIPVYNQVEYTLACLRSLALHATTHRFEVIVVDDGSTDRTQAALAEMPWITYIRQPQNGGFIESCNTGLAQARGTYVLFLNNDTEVMPGWLDELVRTFALRPDAGLVGSKLIYPTGLLQEAGAILWRDGSAWNYGHDKDARRPEYCYLRKVDYCSGASIMLPRALMTRLGGFDRHYAPAYCEDSDLAMRVRQAGHDVLYQPLSELVHYEGVTSGTDIRKGVKAYQVTNTVKMFERWKDTLALRPVNGHAPDNAKDFGLTRRLLVIDAVTPEPDRDAGSVSCMELMRAAQALGYQVTFIPQSNFADVVTYTAALQREGIEALYKPYCTSIRDHLAVQGRRYDAVMVFRVGTLATCYDDIRRYAPQARLVFETSDLHHLREAREAAVTNDPKTAAKALQTKATELGLIAKCDCTIVHSITEKAYLADLLPSVQVEVFNWVLDPIGTRADFAGRQGMMFLGGYRHSPNVDAVHYFLDEIWPLVADRLPLARFYVVGSNLPVELEARRSDRVEMTGFCEDLQPIMDACRLSVVPLRFGAGTKGKLAMSLGYGLPVVSTSIGAEGMGLTDGTAIFVADDPQTFADRIVDMHENAELWAQMSQQALDYVTQNLSRAQGVEVVRRAMGL